MRKISNVAEVKTKTGILGSSSNLVNSIVGAGIIGIPFAFREAGFVAGIFLLIVVGVFTDKSLRMIVNLAHNHPKLKNMGVLTYEDLLAVPYGRTGRIFVLVSMLVVSYGPMVAYLIIIKDNVPDLFGLGETFAEREVVMLVTSLLIMLPLSLLRDISQLWFTSFLSVSADIVLIIIVGINVNISETVANAGGFGQVLADNWIHSGLFIGLGVLSTAMSCQQSSFLISGALRDPTPGRWAQVTGFSLTTATSLTLTLGIIGYLGFLDETRGDVLKNLDRNASANTARAMLSITMFFTYPMESFVARHVLIQLLFNGNMDNTSVSNETGEVVPERKWLRFIGRREFWTIILYLAALVPALIFDDLGPVLSITGALGASCIAYIAPGLAYLGLNGDDFLARTLGTKVASSAGAGEVELPVAGDATARMEEAASSPGAAGAAATVAHGPKPWWWWPTAMPIWAALASSGARGCNDFFAGFGPNGGAAVAPEEHDKVPVVVGPRRFDYCYAIVFIVFGVVAAVAGIVSNVYVQVNNVFYSPS